MENISFGTANPAALHAQTLLRNARQNRAPLTDEQYAAHLNYAYTKTESLENQGITSESMNSKIVNGKRIWNETRTAQHQNIINHFLTKWKNVPCNRKAVLSGGLAGGGKTSTLQRHTHYNLDDYTFLSPDDIKEAMSERNMFPEILGLTPMEVSALGYEESCYITNRLFSECLSQGRNIIYDTTMGSHKAVDLKVEPLKGNGYIIDAVFIDIQISTSLRRSQERHRRGLNRFLTHNVGNGGRLLPRHAVKSQVPSNPDLYASRNREVFNHYRNSGWFADTLVFDNNVDNQKPLLVN